jgi:hypothetical protein
VALQNPLDSAVITGNDFNDAACSGNPVQIFTADVVNSVVINGNNPSGAGRQASFLVNLATADGISTSKSVYNVSEGNGGVCEATTTGNRLVAGVPTGEIVTVRQRGAYRRLGAGQLELAGGNDYIPQTEIPFNPHNMPVPYVGKTPTGSTLRLFVQGRQNQNWAWTSQIRLIEAT